MFVSGENSTKQLFEDTSIKGSFGDQCISPPQKTELDVSKLKSFSSYSGHSVWIDNNGNAFAIGDNSRSQINNISYGKYYDKPTLVKIDGFTPSEKEQFLSAVCGDNYTLYMTSLGRLIYFHEKGKGVPQFFSLTLPNPKYNSKNSKSNDKYISRKPLGLFGGSKRAAVIDEEGDFYIFSEDLFSNGDKSKDKTLKHYSLPEAATSIACCDTFLVVLTNNGKIYGNGRINAENDEFIEVQELSEFGPFTKVTGSYEHCMVLNQEGKAYGFGSNYKGRLSLNSQIRTVDTFVHLDKFETKIYDISAGFCHSIFLIRDKMLFSCGRNAYGELLGSRPTKNCCFTPEKTKVCAETSVPYFIAGCNTSFVFVDCEPPPNRPNKRLSVKRSFKSSNQVESTNKSQLTSAMANKLKNPQPPNPYFQDQINKTNSKEENKSKDAEIEELKNKIEELNENLQKSEEEKGLLIKKLFEMTQVVDHLNNANKELQSKLVKAQLTLELLAVVSNLNNNSSDSDSDSDSDSYSDKKYNDKKQQEADKKRPEDENKQKQQQKSEDADNKQKEKEKQQQQQKKSQQETNKAKPSGENKHQSKPKQKDQTDQITQTKENQQQQKKKSQEPKQKPSNDDKKQQKRSNEETNQKQKVPQEVKQRSTDEKCQQRNEQQEEQQRKQKIKEEERKKREEEKKKTEEERKKAEEEKKQKEEERRRREEEKKQAEEERKKAEEERRRRKEEKKQKEEERRRREEKKKAEEERKRKEEEEEEKKKIQQKAKDDENRQKRSNQKVSYTDQEVQKNREEPANETPESSERSRSRHHHRHRHRSSQNPQQNDENQEKKEPKEPKEPAPAPAAAAGGNNNERAPRRHRRESNDREQAKTQRIEKKSEDDINNQSQVIQPPPSILAQKEIEQKKTIVRPTKAKPK